MRLPGLLRRHPTTPQGTFVAVRDYYNPSIVSGPTSWWLSGGISPSTVTAVYHAAGASSFSNSLINLAAPGTNDSTSSANPGWTSGAGWVYSASQRIALPPTTTGGAVLIRATQGTNGTGSRLIDLNGSTVGYLIPASAGNGSFYLGATLTLSPLSGTHNFAILGRSLYIDDVLIGTPTGTTGLAAATVCLGNHPTLARGWTGTVRWVAIYSTAPTPAQAAAVFAGAP
jgi:hypothetical protein